MTKCTEFFSMEYTVVKYNIDPSRCSRPNKAEKIHSIYRDNKSQMHTTVNGVGKIGRLIRKNK